MQWQWHVTFINLQHCSFFTLLLYFYLHVSIFVLGVFCGVFVWRPQSYCREHCGKAVNKYWQKIQSCNIPVICNLSVLIRDSNQWLNDHCIYPQYISSFFLLHYPSIHFSSFCVLESSRWSWEVLTTLTVTLKKPSRTLWRGSNAMRTVTSHWMKT